MSELAEFAVFGLASAGEDSDASYWRPLGTSTLPLVSTTGAIMSELTIVPKRLPPLGLAGVFAGVSTFALTSAVASTAT